VCHGPYKPCIVSAVAMVTFTVLRQLVNSHIVVILPIIIIIM